MYLEASVLLKNILPFTLFIVINTASIQIIPSTVIAMRMAAGSANPVEIILPVWICSICAVAVGITAVKICSAVKKC